MHRSAWDEFQWEAYLRRLDRVADKLMEVRFYHPPYPFATHPPGTWFMPEAGPTVEPDDAPEEEIGLTSTAGRILRASTECTLKAFQLVPPSTVRGRDASLVVELLASLTAMMAQAARAADAEEDGEEMGKGIALAKRSLAAANTALSALADLRTRYRRGELFELADELTELRNDIAFYVIDLRGQFRSGLSLR